MRTTINLPDDLVNEAMKVSKCETTTDLIKEALKNYIQREKVSRIKDYRGTINIDADLDILRKRKCGGTVTGKDTVTEERR